MGVVSWLFLAVLRSKCSHFTGCLQLDLISSYYLVYMRVVYRLFTCILPFTAILQVIYGTAILELSSTGKCPLSAKMWSKLRFLNHYPYSFIK